MFIHLNELKNYIMKTDQLPTDLINQAITNSFDTNCVDERINKLSVQLREQLWESMKLASQIEILKSMKDDNH